MGKIEPDTTVDMAAYNLLLARLDALETEKANREARTAKVPGWYDKTAAMKPPKDPKSKPGRFSAERILPGGVIVSFYVGGNGKMTIGSHYGTRGVTLWADQDATFDNYAADDGPEGFRADRERVLSTGHWADAPADGSDE
jgi:hypothetical protein